MIGGYQMIDLSSVNIYEIASGFNGKPVLIKTDDGNSIFGAILKDSSNYVLTYVDTDNNLHQVTIKPDSTTTDNIIDLDSGGGEPYVLPIASASTLGGIKVGENLSIDENGVLSASGGDPYVLPTASASTLGGIKVGTNLSIDENGVLSASGGEGDVTFGDKVDVKSYNSSSNKYTAPSDGIIQLSASSSGAYIQCSLQYKGDTGAFLRCSYDYNQATSLYVRKGTKMFFSVQSGSVTAYFHPYVAV